MSPTRTKARKKTPASAPVVSANDTVTSPEVFNLAEAAAYLRFSEAEILRLVDEQSLPGRRVANEWRFLKSAIQDWLRPPPKRGSREAILSVAGAWKDDPYVEEELREIYRKRGRPMTEDGQ